MLDVPAAAEQLRTMYTQYFEVAATYGFGELVGRFDYRASPNWVDALGCSLDQLTAMQLRSIDFLCDVSAPFGARLPALLCVGIAGPRGDAHIADTSITADVTEEYHAAQLANLVRSDVDLLEATTSNNVPEAIGLACAAAAAGLPLSVSFTLGSNHRLHFGPSLRGAIENIDKATGSATPAFCGINCLHPLEFLPAIEPGDWFTRVRCIRPNAASVEKVALCTLGHLEEGDPVYLGKRLGEPAAEYPHIDVWGGCCDTWSKHLGEISQNVLAAYGSSA